MQVILSSFGYKHGQPAADTILDVRFLPNPYYVPELKGGTGLEAKVAAFVMDSGPAREFMPGLVPFLLLLIRMHGAAGRAEIRIAVGCTGGRHRSVAVVEELKRILDAQGMATRVEHRDMDRE